tara:strand:+ start:2351 stop:3049 length:699 start_codon:yes stop_codon:yes gene_type:complete
MEFSKKYLLIFISFLILNNIHLNAANNNLNDQYTVLPKSVQDNYLVKEQIEQDCNKSQILEFFSYSCPACHKIEPVISKLKERINGNQSIVIKQLPVVFHNSWQDTAKLYFAIDKFNLQNKLHAYIFDTIQNNGSNNLENLNIKSILDGYNNKNPNNKVNTDDILKVFNSNIITRDVKNTMRLFYAFNLNSTPVFIVNGKYLISVQSQTTPEDMLNTIIKLAKQDKITCSKN